MNLVEVWLPAIERQAIHRGTYISVKDPGAKIRTFINGWSDRAHPFIWTKAADDILKKANHKTTSDTRHLRTAKRLHLLDSSGCVERTAPSPTGPVHVQNIASPNTQANRINRC
ncbi:hypothetical protein GALL_291890 [mine drainage metagenome]|uniref:Transposase n=1 Tax=mine drainage metagenome TaxID=410659 RepID=A0A1J5RA53_9ZZZZ